MALSLTAKLKACEPACVPEGRGWEEAIVAAVFIANSAESLAASAGLRQGGTPPSRIFNIWLGVLAVCVVAGALGYGLLGSASVSTTAFIQAFAGGAILTMLADTMMPEAFDHGGPVTGLVTVLGFTSAFLLSQLS